jgi:hypothetical protein
MHNSLKIIKSLLYSYSAVHVSGILAPIIGSLLILHIQPLVTVYRWVGCIFQLWSVTARQTKAGRYNQQNDTRWLEAVCAGLGGSWWWAQGCPKHVQRNKNTINFNDFKTIVHLVGFLFIPGKIYIFLHWNFSKVRIKLNAL